MCNIAFSHYYNNFSLISKPWWANSIYKIDISKLLHFNQNRKITETNIGFGVNFFLPQSHFFTWKILTLVFHFNNVNSFFKMYMLYWFLIQNTFSMHFHNLKLYYYNFGLANLSWHSNLKILKWSLQNVLIIFSNNFSYNYNLINKLLMKCKAIINRVCLVHDQNLISSTIGVILFIKLSIGKPQLK